jgi:hypothetical protein
MAGFRTDGCNLLGFKIDDMAAGALIFVRHHVGERFFAAVLRNQFERFGVACSRQFGVGLRGVPHVWQCLPAAFATHQYPGLHEPDLV